MTYKQIADMIAEIGLDYAYYQFSEASGQAPPFIVFYYPADNDVLADSENYVKVHQLIIELYTDNKDFTKEAAVETVLKNYGLVYSRAEQYIETERMYEVIYSTEVIITDGEQD